KWIYANEITGKVKKQIFGSWFKNLERRKRYSIGTERNSQLQIGGGLWVVRDHMGDVFLHSRQIFPANSRHDAKFETLLWTIRGVTSHKLHRVIFAIEDHCLVGIVTKPIKWHAYKFLNSEPIMAN
ncbi:hypothetical protein HID58_048250, partial [Brassica napus]